MRFWRRKREKREQWTPFEGTKCGKNQRGWAPSWWTETCDQGFARGVKREMEPFSEGKETAPGKDRPSFSGETDEAVSVKRED